MTDFDYEYVSDAAHEHLMVEVLFRKQRVCQISKEHGNDDLRIEILTDHYILPEEVLLQFPLSDFMDVLRRASDALRDCP